MADLNPEWWKCLRWWWLTKTPEKNIFYFIEKMLASYSIQGEIFAIKYYLAQDSGFKIQDSRFKKKSMKMHFKKAPDFRKSKYVSTIVLLWSFYFTEKFPLSNAGAFHKNFLSVTCCTFGMLEIRTLTPNRFKNQSSDTLNILGHNCNH